MAKICENCGKKSGFVSGDPLLLNSDKILCSKCAMQIKVKVDELYNTKDENNFKKLKEEVLALSKELYNASVIDELKGLIDRIAQMAFTFIIDAGVFHPFARHCLAFVLFNQLSSHFDSLIPSNSMELELCDCNYNLLNDPTWSASLRGVSGSVITIIHCFFISVNYNSDIFLNSSRFNSFLNSSSVGI